MRGGYQTRTRYPWKAACATKIMDVETKKHTHSPINKIGESVRFLSIRSCHILKGKNAIYGDRVLNLARCSS